MAVVKRRRVHKFGADYKLCPLGSFDILLSIFFLNRTYVMLEPALRELPVLHFSLLVMNSIKSCLLLIFEGFLASKRNIT